MNARRAKSYNEAMGLAWRALAGLLFASLCAAGAIDSARADTQTIATGVDPIVLTQIQGAGTVTVRTWDRPEVSIEADDTINVQHVAHIAAHQLPPITFFAADVQTADGPLTLEPEPFVPPPFDPAGHDLVRLTGTGNVTMHVPATTPFLVTRVRTGAISIDGFHGGTFVAQMGAGQIHLNNVGGTGAVQANAGPIVATNSNFDRLRIRTARGPMYFDNCSARQIEATSLLGTIVYDNGAFQPGLARFETERGSIALGVRGGAQVAAHSESGVVDSEGSIGAGPAVTATSRSGNVVYYDGALRDHPKLAQRLQPRAVNRAEQLEKGGPPRKTRRPKCCGRASATNP